MPEVENRNNQQISAMPRREFIRKSLIASGGVFVGMTTLGNVSLPELTGNRRPNRPSSGKKDKNKDDDRHGPNKAGWRRG